MHLEIDYKIFKLANLYSFVSNLSNWNFSTFPARQKEWLERTGKLSEKDEENLDIFGRIHKESNPLLFLLFFDPKYQNDISAELEKRIGKEKALNLINVLDYFKPRFEKLWEEENKKLEKVKDKFLNEKIENKPVTENIKTLCDLKNEEGSIKITCLLNMSASSVPDCDCWTSENNIVADCSGWPENRFKELSDEIIPHELFHILLRKNDNLINEIQKLSDKHKEKLTEINLENYPLSMTLEELIISSFLPEGYLTNKNPKNPEEIEDFQSIREEFAYLLFNEAKEYIESKEPLDSDYLKTIIQKIKKRTK